MSDIMYADVLVEVVTKELDKTYTYKIPSSLKAEIGMRVLVPFGHRNIEGFIMDIHNKSISYPVKNIISLIDDHPVINKEMMELGKYISNKTLSSLISAYQTMLPSALKARKKQKVNKKYNTYLTILKYDDLMTKKQEELYNFVKEKGKVLKSEASKKSLSITKTLIERGYFKEFKEEVYRLEDDIEIVKQDYDLTLEQKQVLNSISFDKFTPYLLHGVTGSGKTLVYIKLIEKVLKQGKEAILLVPEISLTPQVVGIFKRHFGKTIAILHSGLSNGEKYDEWRKIERKEVSIVIGARSAIFAPFTKLGIIIIDEEHSTTYKQENTPRYNAIDVAIKRGKYYNCPVVLGSATPSVESYTRAKMNVYTLLEMKQRVNNNLPKVTLIDMKDEFKKGNRVFSSLLKEKINDRLSKGEQVIILLNRRGYSTVISCKSCGFTHKCPNCDIPLTYHKNLNVMKCHYCDYTVPKLSVCPNCHSNNINSFGLGTEKLECLIKETFSLARVVRMDVDTTRNKGALEKIINDFKDEKYNILVGTQMIAKGLDFPKVTLAGVINGDASLNIPDFRSGQRTFELLNQLAGRAGRSSLSGEVIIQGFNINHYSIITASKHDYDTFYKREMEIRKALGYPPYFNLCLIKLSGKSYEQVLKEADKIAVYLRENLSDIILGPSTANIPKINNIYYIQIIIKFKKTSEILKSIMFIKNKYSNNKVNIDIDLNPIKL